MLGKNPVASIREHLLWEIDFDTMHLNTHSTLFPECLVWVDSFQIFKLSGINVAISVGVVKGWETNLQIAGIIPTFMEKLVVL